jgi:hypothetical protein
VEVSCDVLEHCSILHAQGPHKPGGPGERLGMPVANHDPPVRADRLGEGPRARRQDATDVRTDQPGRMPDRIKPT